MKPEMQQKFGDISLDEFQKDVVESLTHWRDVHIDRDEWMDWFTGGSIRNCYPTIGNAFFSLNIRDVALYRMAEAATNECVYCEEHGVQNRYDETCECWQRRATTDEVLEFFEDIGEEPDDEFIEDAIYNEGFDDFYRATYPAISDIVDQINDLLLQIDEEENRLLGLQKAMSIAHLGGKIIEDYSPIHWKLIDQVRDEGVLSVWDREEVDEFMKELA